MAAVWTAALVSFAATLLQPLSRSLPSMTGPHALSLFSKGCLRDPSDNDAAAAAAVGCDRVAAAAAVGCDSVAAAAAVGADDIVIAAGAVDVDTAGAADAAGAVATVAVADDDDGDGSCAIRIGKMAST